MARLVEVTAFYRGDADAIFEAALDFSELEDAMRGLAVYEGAPKGEVKEGETYTVDVTFWSVLKNKGHVMHVETLDRAARVIQSREHNPLIKRWDHHLSVEQEGDRVCWTDTIVLDAGWQTPFAARFARFVYRRRHRYRKALEIRTRLARAP